MHVVGKSMNDIYHQLCGKISVQGHDVAGTKELLNSGFTLLDITDNIATARTGYSLPYMLGELALCFTGRDDVEKFLDHISEIERIAMSSDEPKHDIAVYCFDNDIIMEVKDEN